MVGLGSAVGLLCLLGWYFSSGERPVLVGGDTSTQMPQRKFEGAFPEGCNGPIRITQYHFVSEGSFGLGLVPI